MDDAQARDADAVRHWWQNLTPRDAAELRHCRTLLEVAMHRQGLALARALSWTRYRPEHAAGLAKVLAHVKEDMSAPIMRTCGFEKWRDKTGALLSERRYLRLISLRDVDDLTDGLIRLVRLLGGKANVAELGVWMQWWLRDGDPASFNRTMRAISEAYYAAVLPEDEVAP